MVGKFLTRRLSHPQRRQGDVSPLGVREIARELRRQERKSDFTGYTVNFTCSDLRQFLQVVGGSRWKLSPVPISWIKCWHTVAPLREILRGVDCDEERLLLQKQVERLADKIRKGKNLPGIVLVKSQHRRNEHWILDGHRRLLAHRAARVPTIPVYHPLGMFGRTRRGGENGVRIQFLSQGRPQ